MVAGDEVDVRVELATAPREVAVPEHLAAAFDEPVRSAFDAPGYSHRKE